MAEKVDSFPKPEFRGYKYPWDKWMDGSIWTIKQGEDFQVSAHSILSQLYIQAKKRGKRVRAQENDQEIFFQFYDETE